MHVKKSRLEAALVLASWLLMLVCFYTAFQLRSINQKWPYFALLLTVALALINTAFTLSLRKGIMLILLAGLPIMGALSFFTVPAVGYRMQTFAFARNMVFAVLSITTLSLFTMKRTKAIKFPWRKIFVAIQFAALISLLLPYGSNLASVKNYGAKEVKAWAIPVDRDGVTFLAVHDDSIFVVNKRYLYYIDVPNKRLITRIKMPKLNADVGLGDAMYSFAGKLEPNPVQMQIEPRIVTSAIGIGEVNEQRISFGIRASVQKPLTERSAYGLFFKLRLDFDLLTQQLVSYSAYPESDYQEIDIPGFTPRQNEVTEEGIDYYWGPYEIAGNRIAGPDIRAAFNTKKMFSRFEESVYPVPVGDRLVLMGPFGKVFIVEFPD